VIDWLHTKIDDLTELVRAGFTLAAVVLVGYTYVKTRALVALLVAALAAGIFLWVVYNPDWLRDRIGEETGAASQVDVAAAPVEGDLWDGASRRGATNMGASVDGVPMSSFSAGWRGACGWGSGFGPHRRRVQRRGPTLERVGTRVAAFAVQQQRIEKPSFWMTNLPAAGPVFSSVVAIFDRFRKEPAPNQCA
jgi:hypothetical protein